MERNIRHSAEGSHWTKKNHRYIRKEGNRYIYPEDLQREQRKSGGKLVGKVTDVNGETFLTRGAAATKTIASKSKHYDQASGERLSSSEYRERINADKKESNNKVSGGKFNTITRERETPNKPNASKLTNPFTKKKNVDEMNKKLDAEERLNKRQKYFDKKENLEKLDSEKRRNNVEYELERNEQMRQAQERAAHRKAINEVHDSRGFKKNPDQYYDDRGNRKNQDRVNYDDRGNRKNGYEVYKEQPQEPEKKKTLQEKFEESKKNREWTKEKKEIKKENKKELKQRQKTAKEKEKEEKKKQRGKSAVDKILSGVRDSGKLKVDMGPVRDEDGRELNSEKKSYEFHDGKMYEVVGKKKKKK